MKNQKSYEQRKLKSDKSASRDACPILPGSKFNDNGFQHVLKGMKMSIY